MSSDAELSTLYADAGGDAFHSCDLPFEPDHGETISGLRHGVDAMANTRKVWHDFLGQFDISSAILTVTLSGSGAQRHAYLLGFDHVRDDADATQRLLAMMDDLWSRIGEQPVHHFQIAGTGFGAELGAHGDPATGLYDCGVALQMKRGGACIHALFFRQGGSARFSDRDIASLQMVAPLLADSATHAAQLARQSQRSAMLEGMFDRVSLAMALLSADGRPLFINSAATALLGQRKWLIRAADGAIVAANPQQAKELRESIRRAATAPQPVEDVFRLDCSNGDWRLAYVVSAKSRAGDVTARCAMLILMGPGKVDAPSSLLEALGLLPSEQRFLGQFLKSSSLGNAAEGCGLSEETARTYLKRVRAKLGVHRQMELAGLISGLVLPLHTGDGPALWDR